MTMTVPFPSSVRARYALRLLRRNGIAGELAAIVVRDLEREPSEQARAVIVARVLEFGHFTDRHDLRGWLLALGYTDSSCTSCGKPVAFKRLKPLQARPCPCATGKPLRGEP